ncbi:MAG: 23S rRNA (adenine(2503)-C(2))-methyltransferase RlmN, partial [Anaerococcus prevotii]|nr:23S rRNA (adenine(2503)-C(2))-methyltransferase RlmN [Anaerococcus prevotii]
MKDKLNDKSIEELEEIFTKEGYQKFRSKQVYRQIHVNKVNDFTQMSDLSKDMRENLSEKFDFPQMKVEREFVSELDSTKKYLFSLADGNIIEAVFMDYDKRKT